MKLLYSRLFGCQQLNGFIKVQGSVSRKTEANFVIEQRTITKVTPSEFHNSGSVYLAGFSRKPKIIAETEVIV